jgi:hypothetical protein
MGLCKLKDQINYGPKGFVKEREKDHMVKNKRWKENFLKFLKEKIKVA